ncbi:MAG: PilZ domain-containing protein [Phycisphaerae bacterium]|nr:PilZ domain-containing protein [Phycisphaerae bacterium]
MDDILNDNDLIAELATNTRDEVESRRQHARFSVALPLIASPGNFSDRTMASLSGSTVDISQGGCLGVFERAVQVGDIYQLDLDSAHTGLPRIYARCVRARMLHDSAVEAGFSFFASLDANELREAMQRVAKGVTRAAA